MPRGGARAQTQEWNVLGGHARGGRWLASALDTTTHGLAKRRQEAFERTLYKRKADGRSGCVEAYVTTEIGQRDVQAQHGTGAGAGVGDDVEVAAEKDQLAGRDVREAPIRLELIAERGHAKRLVQQDRPCRCTRLVEARLDLNAVTALHRLPQRRGYGCALGRACRQPRHRQDGGPSLHERVISRKFPNRCLPSVVRMDSGWNCTPSTSISRWRRPMISPSSVQALISSTAGNDARSTTSEW